MSLRYRLEALPEYALGSPVMLKFVLENTGSEPLRVLKWYTPLEGLRGNILRVACDGADIAYRGRMVKRGTPTVADYVDVAGGGFVSAEFDLASAFALTAAERCVVAFKGRLHSVLREGEHSPGASHGFVDIPGNEVCFRLAGSPGS